VVALAVLQFFADEIVEAVEARHYPALAAQAQALPFRRDLANSLRGLARALGYSVHSGTVFYNRLAQGQEVVTGFAQGVSADYDNSRINWAAAGLVAEAGDEVIVDHAGRLHEGVHDRRADEAETAPCEVLR
jgi:hypothetical protein